MKNDYGVLQSTARPGKFYIYFNQLARPYFSRPFLWPDGKWHQHTCTIKDWRAHSMLHHSGHSTWMMTVKRPGYFNSRELAQATLDRYLRRASKSSRS